MNCKLYRKRIIPDEMIYLKDDIILFNDNETIITKWESLKRRSDFKYGFSCYYLSHGYKISKFFTSSWEYLYTYCDIISAEQKPGEIIFHDMLIDVIVMPDGFVKVLDLDEISEAYEGKLISTESLLSALNNADKLLKIIYSGGLQRLTAKMDGFIEVSYE